MSDEDFDIEPVRGLPEAPPSGEEILWQGRPNWSSLSLEALSIRGVAIYFVVLALWRFVTLYDVQGVGRALAMTIPFLIAGVLAVLVLVAIAFVLSRTTMYTVTNRRVAMRIGVIVTVTLNLPYSQIANMSLDLRRRGTGTIALDTLEDLKLSYYVCWPHVRPWQMRRVQPALRCVPEAETVAQILANAAETEVSQPRIAMKPPADAVPAE